MWWKYFFPMILNILLWFVLRTFFYFKSDYPDSKPIRIPRIIGLLIILLAFIPIVNYISVAFIIFIALYFMSFEMLFLRKDYINKSKFLNWWFNK